MQTFTQFESGATTAQANNLVLSVLNDGSTYDDRKHCAFAMMQGSSHRVSFADLVKAEANKQHREFGSKFKPVHISEAIKLVQADTIQHCMEIIAEIYNPGRDIIASCRRWFDKVNGNSYYSVNIQIPSSDRAWRQVNIPCSYGYGNQWEYDCADLLEKIGVLPEFPKYENGCTDYRKWSDMKIMFKDEGYGLKRNLYTGMYL